MHVYLFKAVCRDISSPRHVFALFIGNRADKAILRAITNMQRLQVSPQFPQTYPHNLCPLLGKKRVYPQHVSHIAACIAEFSTGAECGLCGLLRGNRRTYVCLKIKDVYARTLLNQARAYRIHFYLMLSRA